MAIRILIADDHEIVRRGLMTFLGAFDEFVFVGEAANGRDAVTLAADTRPDVILIDLMMPELNGINAIRQIRAHDPNTHIIALTSSRDDELVASALQAGATSYIMKSVPVNDLPQVIRDAFAGKRTLAPEATQALINIATRPKAPNYKLTDRELQVLGLMAKGKNNNEIAEMLIISRSTVKFHISSILAKLGATTRTEAVALALHNHLIMSGED